MAQGRIDAASAAMRRVLNEATDAFKRTKLLPAQVEIMLAAGEVEEAGEACRELEELAAAIDTDVVRAMAAHSRGAVALAEENARDAIGPLRRAFEMWEKAEVPHEAARTRMLLGLACKALGDDEAASLELAAAKAVFERLGAASDMARIDALQTAPAARRRNELTPRELQVLRLIAAGKTNKAIARQLAVSERTVDRHVSNILTRLGVPSRAAATAYAYDHKLF
jgi:DNA-binding NarL/FixJ family response regulator